ncbi:hypothetical protein [Streptomyces sp. NBC_00467]|uniref:hypothetical protein n=1 Tax=Streptomyces sp. NBC_00467 TaxID=2975752 RepID=UPI002E18EE00
MTQLDITKTHTGDFARGGQGEYTITVTNSGDEALSGTLMTDALPAGITLTGLTITDSDSALSCQGTGGRDRVRGGSLLPGGSWTLSATVAIADDAPCSVTNTASVTVPNGGSSDSASDPTTVTGGTCDDNGDGGGGSILPINLDGVIPMFNDITTNSNINSPGAANTSGQIFGMNAP